MTLHRLNAKINFLTIYLIVCTIALFAALMYILWGESKSRLQDELSVKRVNILGEDGSLRMVISNEQLQHPGRVSGRDIPARERPPGILFFDNNGNECGGLVYEERNEGNTIDKMMSFTMDNRNNDQVLQLLNDEQYENGKAAIKRGVHIREYPIGANLMHWVDELAEIEKVTDSLAKQRRLDELMEREGPRSRLYLGLRDEKDGLFLYDKAGRPRLNIYIDEYDNPQIDVLDSLGNIKRLMD